MSEYIIRPKITLAAATELGAEAAGKRLLDRIFQDDDVLAIECDPPVDEEAT